MCFCIGTYRQKTSDFSEVVWRKALASTRGYRFISPALVGLVWQRCFLHSARPLPSRPKLRDCDSSLFGLLIELLESLTFELTREEDVTHGRRRLVFNLRGAAVAVEGDVGLRVT